MPTFREYLIRNAAPTLLLTGMLFLLAGCPSQSADQTNTQPVANTSAFGGAVFGGRQPIVGATITAFVATSGIAAPVIGTATTDASGNFSMTFSPTPASGAMVYAVVDGGISVPGASTANGAIRLMTVAGTWCSSGPPACPDFHDNVNINELTTVAATYSLAGFISLSPSRVDVLGTAPGLPNAVKTFENLIDPASGQAAVPGATGCTGSGGPTNCDALRRLHTLANIAAACVNTTSATSTLCNNLFTVTFPSSGVQPDDTLEALLNIATVPEIRNKGSSLYALSTPASVIFSPALAAAPNAWALAVAFEGGGLYQPAGIAVDSQGNVWVANYQPGDVNGIHDGSISKFATDGTTLSPASGFTGGGLLGSWGLAIDIHDNVWVANWNGGDGDLVSKFTNDGSPLDADGYPLSGIDPGPVALAIVSGGNIWVANFGNSSLSKLDSSGNELGRFTGAGLALPIAVAVDATGNLWHANQGNTTVSEFNSAGVAISPSAGYAGGGLSTPDGLALDANGNVWVSNFYGDSVSQFVGGSTPPTSCPATPGSSHTGCPLSPAAGFTGGGLVSANFVAIDSAGHVFISNFHGNSISELAVADGSALSPANGYRHPAISLPEGIAIDASGNLWLANFGNNSILKFIGIAAPVKTPLIGLPSAP